MNNEREREVLRQALHIKKCRASLEYWATHAAKDFVEPGADHRPARHQRLLIQKLQDVADGKIKRLMIFMPPGSAKSTYTSKIFVPWYMARFPKRQVIAASNTASLAETFSRSVQECMREHALELGVHPLEDNKELWKASNGSAYRAAGVGGTITGFRADLGIIDDPFIGRQQAYSAVQRDTVWGWYANDFFTRAKPDAALILIQTRWHVDDLGGRLLDEQAGDWTVLNLPSIWEGDDDEPAWPDGLGRKKGELLWPDYQNEAFIAGARKTLGEMDFSAMHQQSPVSASGNLFRIEKLGTIPAASVTAPKIVRAWDFAATREMGTGKGDFTVGVKMQRNPNGTYTVLDVKRGRFSPEQVEDIICTTAEADGPDVLISIPQDPGSAGKIVAANFVRMLAGYRIHVSTESGKKEHRAMPFAAQVEAGNVNMLAGVWNKDFKDELQLFPGSKFDDQVDAASRAFSQLIEPVVRRRATSWGHSSHMGR